MSMSPRMAELALKKRILQQRSAVLRRTFAAQVAQGVAPVLGGADRAIAAGRWLKQHPALLAGAAVALLVWRPKGMVMLAGRGLWLWQTWLKLQPMLARLNLAQAVSPTPEATMNDASALGAKSISATASDAH
jgi:YqjK-like protein